ncbi:MAG: cysteine synthase [Anaerolineae bacterium UTCFX2]|jgi:cysteine synthase B|nr:cysteine synthase family protein [Anaerolineae bacterium]MCZ7552703.1 cysteine synthase family protein [Anaerolineales bacterium]OQY94245.1 MAG: cysteine synthase [Anaerolineae bacterium UTCFX2]
MEIITIPQIQVSLPATASLATLVGNTPLIPLHRVTSRLSPDVQVLVKAEWFNPGGSIKDRPALNILRTALADGSLSNGKKLLDSTSGNMGIAYATLGAAFGVRVTLALPANASRERIKILRALGAELILTDPLEGTDGAMRVVRQLAAEQPERYFYANQYDNPANWQAHYATTGPEILQQTMGEITHFVAGMGTTGTLTGVSSYLREYLPHLQVAAVQPDGPFHGLEGLKHLASSIRPGFYDPSVPDRVIEVSTEAAYSMVRKLAQQEGLFVGISSGAAAQAAIQIAEGLTQGVVVTVFPDAGYKYLSDDALWGAGE